jgi:hypothetical protein
MTPEGNPALKELQKELFGVENSFTLPQSIIDLINKYGREGIAVSCKIIQEYLIPETERVFTDGLKRENPNNHSSLICYQAGLQTTEEIGKIANRLKSVVNMEIGSRR